MSRKAHVCPVCGFPMALPPRDFHVCPSCGTEFGLDDAGVSHEELRQRWLSTGPGWWSPVDPVPDGWDPIEQVHSAGLLSRTVMVSDAPR